MKTMELAIHFKVITGQIDQHKLAAEGQIYFVVV